MLEISFCRVLFLAISFLCLLTKPFISSAETDIGMTSLGAQHRRNIEEEKLTGDTCLPWPKLQTFVIYNLGNFLTESLRRTKVRNK